MSQAKSSFGFILGSNDQLPHGESQGKIFLTLTPLGGDRGQKSILGSNWAKMEKWPQFSQLFFYFYKIYIDQSPIWGLSKTAFKIELGSFSDLSAKKSVLGAQVKIQKCFRWKFKKFQHFLPNIYYFYLKK